LQKKKQKTACGYTSCFYFVAPFIGRSFCFIAG